MNSKQWIRQHLLADRADVLSQQGIGEVEFYQNERFSLKHVTNEFFLFVRDLDVVWVEEFKDYGGDCIKDIKKILLNSNAMKQKFFSLSGHLSDGEKESEFCKARNIFSHNYTD